MQQPGHTSWSKKTKLSKDRAWVRPAPVTHELPVGASGPGVRSSQVRRTDNQIN